MSQRPIQVLYNASAVPERMAGAGVYTVELGRALAARGSLSLSVLSPRDPGFGRQLRTPSSTAHRIAWEESSLSTRPALRDADVYHGPHFFVPRSAPAAVATVHDLTFFRTPRRYDVAHRLYYRHLARTAARAGRIIVPSPAVAGDCVRFLGYPPKHVRVIAEAPRAGFQPATADEVAAFRHRNAVAGPYFACLGTAEPGKRAIDAVRALPAIRDRYPHALLLLAGNPGRLSAPLQREVNAYGLGEAVRFLGYLPDADLPAFLSAATALIFPSLYEGFGLPPLEALACGTPVVTTRAPAMDQVLTAGTLFLPPRDPAAIARACITLLEGSRRDELSAQGRAFASSFSWARAAEETEAVYRELVS